MLIVIMVYRSYRPYDCHNNNNKITYIIDITVPSDNNTKRKHSERIEKYTSLAVKMQKIWKQNKIRIIPMIISVTGVTAGTFKGSLMQLELQPKQIHEEAQKNL